MVSKNILLIMLVVLSLPVMMAQETTTRTALETDAVSADAEVRTVALRDFVSRTRAQIQLNFGGEVFRGQSILHLDSINLEEGETYRCGAGEQGQIVCQSSTSDDLWCWGRGELSRCPRELSEADNLRISAGGGAGKVSIQDFTTKSERDDEIEVLSWSWGRANPTAGFDDADEEELVLEYAWFVNSKASGDEKPAETLSLSFTKIEMAGFEDDDSITVVIEDIRVPEHGLLFGTLTLEGEAKKAVTGRNPQTGKEIQIAAGLGEEDQERPEEERRPDYLDVDDDGDGVPTTMETNRGVIHRDLAARNALEWSEEEREQVRETLQNMETLQGRDFGLAVALSASENERVRSVKYDEERNVVEIEHEEDMRLLGFIRMNAKSKTTVHEDGTEETRRPWWSFLATKPAESAEGNSTSGSGRFGYSIEEGKKL